MRCTNRSGVQFAVGDDDPVVHIERKALHLFRSPHLARLNHPRIPDAPARATVLKIQISLASFLGAIRS